LALQANNKSVPSAMLVFTAPLTKVKFAMTSSPCVALGVKIEGKTPKEITAEINDGKWDEKFQ